MHKYIFSLAVSGLFAFAAGLYAPLNAYWSGMDEFPFAAGLLFGAMLPFFVIAWGLAFIALRLLALPFTHKSAPCLGREIRVSPPDILILSCVAALWLEGSVLSKGLPAVTGAPGLFDSTPRSILDSAAWLAVFILGYIVWKRGIKAAVFSAAALAVVLAAGLGDAWLNRGVKTPVRATAPQVYANLSFHPEENVIIIVADGFPTYMAERVLQDEPELAAGLDGFIFLRNNLASGGQTNWAIPAMLQGAVYEGGDYQDFAEKVFSSKGGLIKLFEGLGWKTYIASGPPKFNFFTENSYPLRVAMSLSPELYGALVFKFMPYLLKRSMERVVIAYTLGYTAPPPTLQNPRPQPAAKSTASFLQNNIIPRLDNRSANLTMHFYHYYGAHIPYRFDARGGALAASEQSSESGLQATAEWELRCFIDFLKSLKKRNMYDGATIVLTADHGDLHRHMRGELGSYEMPVLLIKPRGARGRLELSDAPTSNAQLPELVMKAYKGGQELAEFLAGLPGERKLFRPPDELFAVSGVEPEELIFKPLNINTRQKPTILTIGDKYTFIRGGESDQTLAVPLEISGRIYLSGGSGIDIYPPGGSIKLSVNRNPGQKADINFPGLFYHYKELFKQGHLSLTITDDISGKTVYIKEETIPADEVWTEFDIGLKNISVAKSGTVSLSFKTSSPENCLYVLKGVAIGDSTNGFKE